MCFRQLQPESTSLWQTYYVVIKEGKWFFQTKNETREMLECRMFSNIFSLTGNLCNFNNNDFEKNFIYSS